MICHKCGHPIKPGESWLKEPNSDKIISPFYHSICPTEYQIDYNNTTINRKGKGEFYEQNIQNKEPVKPGDTLLVTDPWGLGFQRATAIPAPVNKDDIVIF